MKVHRANDEAMEAHATSGSERDSSTPPTTARAAAVMPKRLRPILSLEDLEHAAKRHLPRPIFGYVSGAAETGASLRDNRAAFAEFGFITRVLRDVSTRSQETALMGQTYSAPFGIAPMGIAALSAYRGDLVLAGAARRARIPMVMSGSSLIRLEDVLQENPHAWFQAYLPGEPAKIDALVDRVQAAGYGTLVLTVDTAVLANRENNVRTGFSTPLRPSLRLAWDGLVRPRWLVGTALRTLFKHGMPHFENSQATRGAAIVSRSVMRDFGAKDHLSWTHLAQIRRRWRGRLVVKGIMSPDDALIARDEGADGIVVSNHGGRQLDGTVSPLRVLPSIVERVGREYPVMMDGGIRRGTDIVKALALGAKFVFVGRPFVYAAAIGGQAGVEHAIRLLADEVRRDLGLLGLDRLHQLGREHLLPLREFGTWRSTSARSQR